MTRPPLLSVNFFAQLSHDLRSPLNNILMWCDLMGRSDVSQEALASGLAAIEASAKLQVEVIEELMDAAYLVADSADSDKSWLSWVALTDMLVERTKRQCLRKGVKLECCVGSLDKVFGNAHRLERILLNLILHCIHFTTKGGKVVFGGENRDNEAVVYLIDTGKPFDSETLTGEELLSDRMSNARTRSNDRRLLVAHHCIEQQGGRLETHFDEGEHANHLRVVLPLPSGAVVLS